MNIIWTSLVVASCIVLTIQNPQLLLTTCTNSANQALQYAFTLCAVYCLWLGVFEVAEKCNVVQTLAKVLSPINKWLFGKISPSASKCISLNMASNLLGIGNAATPSAIQAIQQTEKGTKLSRAGAMLFVINASGIQLVPTTVIGLRASFNSTNPSSILLPTLICNAISTVLGVALVSIAHKKTV